MLPACRAADEGFTIPHFAVMPSDVPGFMEELWEFQSTFHDCFARSEPRAHFFDSMVGQFSKLERKSIEPMALQVEGGTIRELQRFISDGRWDDEQMRWNYHQFVADELGEPEANPADTYWLFRAFGEAALAALLWGEERGLLIPA